MTGPLFARRLARVLATELPDTIPPPDDREATVRAMKLALQARGKRRARVRWAGGIGAAAAVVLGVFGAARRPPAPQSTAVVAAPVAPTDVVVEHESGGVLVQSGGRTSPLVDSKPLGTGDHVLALLDGRATIALETGTRLSVAGGGDVVLLSAGATQVFALDAGSVRADVAKLHPGERFVIRTADAEVEVRGTSFFVSTVPSDPACGAGTTTRVNVFNGVVTVRAGTTEAAVPAGESWPPGCSASPRSSGGPASPPPRATVAGAPPSASRFPVTPAVPSSELAAQNDLFDQAMLAKRRGDPRGAIASFDRLLSRYPACPLAESAAAERMKLLADIDSARAADAARDYLRSYPSGFARGDAETLLR